MFTRTLGRSGMTVTALGMGCWAIGGVFYRDGKSVGWGEVNDEQSLAALHRALELGVTFFDTADVYGCGHSERILGQAIAGHRDKIVIATKFGNVFNAANKTIVDANGSARYVEQACEASLQRLNTDYIDLYQFHVGNHDPAEAVETREACERLVRAGKIRAYGWSTDDPERAAVFAEGRHCTSVQQHLNLFGGNRETLALCERENLASINRGPLAMGLLTGKFSHESSIPSNDVRAGWDFQQGAQARQLEQLEQLRGVLTEDGRTLAQAALGWLWAVSEATIPIPGFKTVQQVEENVAALERGPLSEDQMARVEQILQRGAEA